MRGRTRWMPRNIEPVRNGTYECIVRIPGGIVTVLPLEWDGMGFIVPMPMIVRKWRGLTKRAYDEEVRRIEGEGK